MEIDIYRSCRHNDRRLNLGLKSGVWDVSLMMQQDGRILGFSKINVVSNVTRYKVGGCLD